MTDDATGIVTIRLGAPDPDFLHKLALPYASIVPPGTPATSDRPVPGTGPYRVASYSPNRRVQLVRNRHFRTWSKAAQPEALVDQIVLEPADTPDAGLNAIERGHADGHFPPFSAFPQDSLQEARTRYAAQLHVTPAAWTYYFALNRQRPPFDDVRARQAVAFAVDRGRLVERLGGDDLGAPACQLLPPNFPAYRRYCPHTAHPSKGGAWTAPDLGRARQLVAESGTEGMPVDVVGVHGTVEGSELTTSLVQTLKQLGYRTRVTRLTPKEYFALFAGLGPSGIEATFLGWIADYPSPANFMTAISCPYNQYSCDLAFDRRLRELVELQTRDAQAANEAWARLDRKVADQALIVPLINPNWVDFVSKRVGNYQRHPVFGMLLSQVWVR